MKHTFSRIKFWIFLASLFKTGKFCSIYPFLYGSSFSDVIDCVISVYVEWNRFCVQVGCFLLDNAVPTASKFVKSSNWNIWLNRKCPLIVSIHLVRNT